MVVKCAGKASRAAMVPPAEKDKAVGATSGTTILIQPDTGTNTALRGVRGRKLCTV